MITEHRWSSPSALFIVGNRYASASTHCHTRKLNQATRGYTTCSAVRACLPQLSVEVGVTLEGIIYSLYPTTGIFDPRYSALPPSSVTITARLPDESIN
eukprot:IDg21899t1